MDTFKDRERLEALHLAPGGAPWVLWNGPRHPRQANAGAVEVARAVGA
jgi:hypothetical protein